MVVVMAVYLEEMTGYVNATSNTPYLADAQNFSQTLLNPNPNPIYFIRRPLSSAFKVVPAVGIW